MRPRDLLSAHFPFGKVCLFRDGRWPSGPMQGIGPARLPFSGLHLQGREVGGEPPFRHGQCTRSSCSGGGGGYPPRGARRVGLRAPEAPLPPLEGLHCVLPQELLSPGSASCGELRTAVPRMGSRHRSAGGRGPSPLAVRKNSCFLPTG